MEVPNFRFGLGRPIEETRLGTSFQSHLDHNLVNATQHLLTLTSSFSKSEGMYTILVWVWNSGVPNFSASFSFLISSDFSESILSIGTETAFYEIPKGTIESNLEEVKMIHLQVQRLLATCCSLGSRRTLWPTLSSIRICPSRTRRGHLPCMCGRDSPSEDRPWAVPRTHMLACD